jgi:hypothetical protein
MWITEDNFVIRRPRAITIDGVNHPPDIFTEWSQSELASIGIKPFTEQGYNGQYYDATSVTDVEVDGVVTRTYGTKERYTLAQLKQLKIDEVNEQAYEKLQPTDWYIVRNTETSDPIPSEVTTARAAIRTIANDSVDEINAETDYATLTQYSADWGGEV